MSDFHATAHPAIVSSLKRAGWPDDHAQMVADLALHMHTETRGVLERAMQAAPDAISAMQVALFGLGLVKTTAEEVIQHVMGELKQMGVATPKRDRKL